MSLGDSKLRKTEVNRTGTGMVFIAAVTTLSAAGIGFYIRFLLALCGECKPRWMSVQKAPRIRFREPRSVKSLPVKAGPLFYRGTVSQAAPIITFRAPRRDQI